MGERKDDKPISSDTDRDNELDNIISSDALDDLDMSLDEDDLSVDQQSSATRNFEDMDLSLSSTIDEKNSDNSEYGNHDFGDLEEMTLDDFMDDAEDAEQAGASEIAPEVPAAESGEQVSGSDIEVQSEPSHSDGDSSDIPDQPETALPDTEATAEPEQDTGTTQISGESDSELKRRSSDKGEAAIASEPEPDSASTPDDPLDLPHPDNRAEKPDTADQLSDSAPENTEDALSELFDDDLADESLLDDKAVVSSSSDSLKKEHPGKNEAPNTPDETVAEPDLADAGRLPDLPPGEITASSHTAEQDADALEKDIESLLDSNRHPENSTSTNNIDTPQKETNVSETPQNSPSTGTKKKLTPDLNMANSITMSLGLIAVLVAALAVWFGLDAAQQADSLKKEPEKLQQQIKLMDEQQQQQTTALVQQVETLQQQLNDLTKVVANKATENWQASNDENSTVKSEAGSAEKPQDTAVTRTQPVQLKVITPEQKPVTVNKPAASKSTAKPKAVFEVDAESIKGWVIVLSSMESQEAAITEVRRLRAKDIKAEFTRVILKGKVWYRVRISGFANKREATAYQKYLNDFHAIDSWHHKI